jgi:hypothetical protein
LTSNNKRAPHDVDDDDDGESHAADEPTAVWDESALRAAGLSDLLHKRDDEPPPPPATSPTPSSTTDPSIVIDPSTLAPKVVTPVPQQAPQAGADGGLGWGATLGLAVALGAIVYALIRFVKG